MSKRSVTVRISGQEYRIRSEADEAWLQRVASSVDAVMSQIRARTGAVDSLDVAILTSLNLARELLACRASAGKAADGIVPDRLRGLIELAESAASSTAGRGQAADSLLTVPAGDEVDAIETELLGSLVDPIESGVGAGGGDGAGRAGT